MTPPSAPDKDPVSTSPARRRSAAWPIWALIGICVGIEAVLQLADAGLFGLPPRMRQTAYENIGFWPGLLDSWQPNFAAQPYTMFFSYSFVHNGLFHMLVNMITLYSLGTAVHARVRTSGFALLYVTAVLGGGLGFGLLADSTRPMVGASGGLFGLVGGILAWNYVDRFSAALRLWPVAQGVALLLALNLAMWWLMDGLLAWQTHLGGFVAGWIMALLIDPRSKPVASQNTNPPD